MAEVRPDLIFQSQAPQEAGTGLKAQRPSSSSRDCSGVGTSPLSASQSGASVLRSLKDLESVAKETHNNVIRIAPPLIITRQKIDWAFERIPKVVERN